MSVRARKALFEGGGESSNHDLQQTPTPTRKALGFLSANTFKKRSTNSKQQQQSFSNSETSQNEEEEDAVEQLKIQIHSIQRRIKGLDQQRQTPDLKGIVFHPATSKQQHEQLQELTRKLIHIQTGLRDIEGERCALVTKSKQLEHETRHLNCQLRRRDQEIAALQKRCQSETAKHKEMGTLQSINSDLNRKMRFMEQAMGKMADYETENRVLSQQLSACHESEYNLTQQLKDVQTKHDTVSEEFSKCLETVKTLTTEKQVLQEEKLRLEQQSNLKVDQQRLAHLNSTSQLKEELAVFESKSHQQERLLTEQAQTIKELRQNIRDLQSNRSDTTQNAKLEYETKLQGLRQSHQDQLASLQNQHDAELANLQSLIQVRNGEIDSLRSDLDTQMQQLMSATSDLQRLQENNNTVEGLLENVEQLEKDRVNLQDEIHDKGVRVAELDAQVLKLQVEQELSTADTNRLHSELSSKDSTIRSLKAQVSRLTAKLERYQSQSSTTRANLESQVVALETSKADLQATAIACQRKHQSEIKKLSDSLAQARSDYQSAQAMISKQSRHLDQASTRSSLQQAALDSNQRSEIAERNQDYKTEILGLKAVVSQLQCEMEASQANSEAKDNEMASLEAALQDHIQRLSKVTNQNDALQAQVSRAGSDYENMEEKSSLLQIRLLDKDDEIKRLKSDWQSKEDDYLDQIHTQTMKREICETDLFSLRNQLERKSATDKGFTELEKENQTLKDKIRRQEAFLKRKLEQQKLLRDRHSGLSTNLPPLPCTTTNKPWQRKSGSSQATLSTVSDDGDSFSWKMDDAFNE